MSPALFLSVIISGLCAAFGHLLWGRRYRELPLFWLLGLAGFWLGQLASSLLHLNLLVIGTLHPVEGVLGAFAVLLLVKWLRI